MKSVGLLAVLFFLLGTTNNHNKRFIEGTVRDAKTNQAIAFANLYIDKSRIGTNSNKEGYYKLLIPDSVKTNKLVLFCKYVGMVDQSRKISIKKLPISIDFNLKERQAVLTY